MIDERDEIDEEVPIGCLRPIRIYNYRKPFRLDRRIGHAIFSNHFMLIKRGKFINIHK